MTARGICLRVAAAALVIIAGTGPLGPAQADQRDGTGGIVQPDACDGRWHVMPSVQDNRKQRSLYDVVALSASDVWAVGSDVGASHFARPLAEHWDGAAWTVITTPLPVGARSGVLRSVTAVGPNVWAVGEYENSDGTANLVLALRWNGTAWKIMSTGILGNDAQAYGVDAISPSDVWMVGQKGIHTTGFWTTFSAHWNGATWSAVSTPNKPNSVDDWLRDVSAVGSGGVWAVGAYTDSSSAHGMTLHWTGSAWSIVKSPPSFELRGVTALSATNAWASGLTSGFAYETERWNGTKWISSTGELGTDAQANGVDAAGAGDVWAAGDTFESQREPLMQHWNGSLWTRVDADFPTASALSIEDVSVLGNGSRAYAVGYYLATDASNSRGLVLRWC